MLKSLAAVSLSLAVLVAPAHAEDDVQHHVDRLIAPLMDARVAPTIVVGVVHRGEQYVFGYGALPDGSTPDGQTVYEIGSITKGFTGLLLADAQVRGRVQIDDAIDELWPEGVAPPRFDGDPVSFAHLATHTSGLPRVPTNMNTADLVDPYADYTADDMFTFLDGYRPAIRPGAQHAYSNLGTGLLGYLLATDAGVTYDQLVVERIATPLGMTMTSADMTDAQRALLAPGQRDGDTMGPWTFDALAGCGAIRSNTDDMLKLIEALLDPESTPLAEQIAIATIARYPMPGSPAQVGLGWMTAGDGQTVFHNGQTGGYSSMLLANAPAGTGVVVMGGAASGMIDVVAQQIIRALFGIDVEPMPLPVANDVAPERLERLAGDYESEAGFVITVAIEDGVVRCGVVGQPTWTAMTESETAVFNLSLGVQMVFHVEGDEPPATMTFTQQGRSFECVRK